ncbi:MAG: holo-[acyl-carrier-protein] synthase [Comamonadaceae bacterium]|nr:MAG: holo-[acyl-carrier-protein] synthase [Comamonadaceae bacterium]
MDAPSVRCVECHSPRDNVRIGVDIVEVNAIQASLAAFGDRFLQRIFSPHEIAIAGRSVERLAARFAAKEAAIKALDMPEVGVAWCNIELHSDAAGRPSLRFHGRALTHVNQLGLHDISVSLSHERGMAFAAVIALQGPAMRRENIKSDSEKSCHTP